MKLDKTYKPQQTEPQIYNLWEKAEAFKPKNRGGKQNFSLVIPPPNANGNLHLGHGLTLAIEDIVVRYHRAFSRLAEESGIPADVVETAFWHYNDDVCKGQLSLDEFNRKFAERIGVKSLDWQKYYLEAIDPIPQMQELLTWAVKYYDVGLMSNIMPGFIDAMLSRKLIPDVKYGAIIDSSKEGAIKPEARIYETALEKTGCKPEEILLVDDSRANIMAAEKMGWHVLWFDDYRPSESAKHVRQALEPAD